VPPFFFYVLLVLADPPWPGITAAPSSYAILALAYAWPLFVLSFNAVQGPLRRWAALGIASFGSCLLCLHGGLSSAVVIDLDVGTFISLNTFKAIAGVFLGVSAIPAGLLVALGFKQKKLYTFVFLPALFGALSQLGWFGLLQLVEGQSGIHFWLWSRMLIHAVVGMVAGILVGGSQIYRPTTFQTDWGGISEMLVKRLPRALPLAILVTLGLAAAGSARIAAEHADSSRFVTSRFDDYFLSLSNLRRAHQAQLVYPGLYQDLHRSRSALLGAASFDPELIRLLKPMLKSIERGKTGKTDQRQFKRSVLAVNRRLLAGGEPYFLEPHSINDGQWPMRFVLRYRVSGRARFRIEGGGSMPVIRLRRLDDILVDTPYTGLSYEGLGTVLMDHIDDVALRSYGRLFEPGATMRNPDDGRFQITRSMIRSDRKAALKQALLKQGIWHPKTLEQLAAIGTDWRQVIDVSGARRVMDAPTLVIYDALAELLAQQTEVHEARHAFDGEWTTSLDALEALTPAGLGPSAVQEVRAYLTEIIDGPLGPRFALSTVLKMIAGPGARANAYFFAAVLILEGLWGEKIRRPDFIEIEGPNGPKQIVAPITPEHPGWLSFSRILGAHSDLRALPPEALKAKAKSLFRVLFNEEYRPITKLR